MCPSRIAKHRYFVSVGDDKKVLLWKHNEELKLQASIDLGIQLFRASFSLTGHNLFISGLDKLVTLSFDPYAETISKLSSN